MPARETITIVNRTGAPVTVARQRRGARRLARPRHASTRSRATTVEAVIDQGDVWRFRLTVGPTASARSAGPRTSCGPSGWTLTIPADAADRLPEHRRAG